MGSLYRLGQKFVDFCNVVQQNQNSEVTVPSSKVLYDETNEIRDALTKVTQYTDRDLLTNVYTGFTVGELKLTKTKNIVSGIVALRCSSITLPNNTDIAVLPSYLRPVQITNVLAFNRTKSPLYLYINPNGSIATSWGDTVTDTLAIPMTFITADDSTS